MVSECANPQCATPFLYLTKGSLLAVKDRRGQRPAAKQDVEWFWLCERCSPWFEIWIRSDGQSTCVSRSSLRVNTNPEDSTEVRFPAA